MTLQATNDNIQNTFKCQPMVAALLVHIAQRNNILNVRRTEESHEGSSICSQMNSVFYE